MSYPEEDTSPVAAPSLAALLKADGELEPGTTVGEYQVESRLGSGAMGMVYSAVQPVIGKRAAIKIMAARLCVDPVAVERFTQEARAVNQIGHPNIVDVFAFGALPDGRSYMVMELLQGETLGTRLRKGPVPLVEAIAILFQICDGLAAAHDKGIVHRDLKPENIFLVPVRVRRLLVKLLDFGVAKLRGAAGVGRVDHTKEGMAVGTPRYMSPEQARGKDADHRADVYSLGVTAYEMLVGKLPFDGDESIDLMHKHVYQLPPSPRTIKPELPQEIDRLLLQMLEKKPDRRPTLPQVESILADVRDNLLGLRDVDTGPMGLRAMEEPTGTRRHRKPAERTDVTDAPPVRDQRRTLIGVTVALVALAVVMVAFKLRSRSHAPAPIHVVSIPVAAQPAAPGAARASAPAPTAAVAPPSTLVVRVNVPDARIELDGKLLASAAHEGRFTVAEAGEHSLAVSAPHRRPLERKITLAPGAEVAVDLELERALAPAPTHSKTKLKAGRPGDRDYMVDPFATKR